MFSLRIDDLGDFDIREAGLRRLGAQEFESSAFFLGKFHRPRRAVVMACESAPA
jgi:hypothetical protein